jgi:GT2 family glycosyltransferase
VTPPQRSLDIIIVNWNAGLLLRRCLAALSGACDASFALRRVVVVDNASTDGSLDGLETLPIQLTVIRNTSNRGFGAACNQGARGSTADFLLFLNPDVYVTSTSIRAPIEYLTGRNDAGVASIQLRDSRGVVSRSCARIPTPRLIAARILGLDVLFPRYVTSLFMSEWDHLSTREVPHVIGAFYMIRRTLFEDLGGFDERYFVYLEDLDLSTRVHERGFKIVFIADTHAEHTGGGTSDSVKPLRIAYSLHSRILYGRKHFRRISASALTFGTLVVEPVARLIRALARRRAGEMLDTVTGFVHLWRRVLRDLLQPAEGSG